MNEKRLRLCHMYPAKLDSFVVFQFLGIYSRYNPGNWIYRYEGQKPMLIIMLHIVTASGDRVFSTLQIEPEAVHWYRVWFQTSVFCHSKRAYSRVLPSICVLHNMVDFLCSLFIVNYQFWSFVALTGPLTYWRLWSFHKTYLKQKLDRSFKTCSWLDIKLGKYVN